MIYGLPDSKYGQATAPPNHFKISAIMFGAALVLFFSIYKHRQSEKL